MQYDSEIWSYITENILKYIIVVLAILLLFVYMYSTML